MLTRAPSAGAGGGGDRRRRRRLRPGGARRFAASKSSDECGPAAARTSAAVSAESSRGRCVWLTGLPRSAHGEGALPLLALERRRKVVGIVSCCLGASRVTVASLRCAVSFALLPREDAAPLKQTRRARALEIAAMVACVPRVARAWPPTSLPPSSLTAHAAGARLHSEYVGRPTRSSTGAELHQRRLRTSDERHAQSLERWLRLEWLRRAVPDGEPPLVFARRRLRTLALKLLDCPTVDGGVDGALRDGLTALHLAALGRDEALASALLMAGARRALPQRRRRRPARRADGVPLRRRGWRAGGDNRRALAAAPESVAPRTGRGARRRWVAAPGARRAARRSRAADRVAPNRAARRRRRRSARRRNASWSKRWRRWRARRQSALRARLAQLSVRERARAALNIDERPLHAAHVLRGEVSAADCDWLLGRCATRSRRGLGVGAPQVPPDRRLSRGAVPGGGGVDAAPPRRAHLPGDGRAFGPPPTSASTSASSCGTSPAASRRSSSTRTARCSRAIPPQPPRRVWRRRHPGFAACRRGARAQGW